MKPLLDCYWMARIKHLGRKLSKETTDLELKIVELLNDYNYGNVEKCVIALVSITDQIDICTNLSKKIYYLSLHVDSIDSNKLSEQLMGLAKTKHEMDTMYNNIIKAIEDSFDDNKAS